MKFATVNYQGQVRSADTLAAGVERDLSIRPFPASPPMDYTDRTEFEGYKFCRVGDFVCLSTFSYESTRDETGRPVLSAVVALLTDDEFAAVGQDIVLLRNYLRSTSEPTESGFNDFHQTAVTVSNQSGFTSLSDQFDPTFLGQAMSYLLTAEQAHVLYTDESRRDAFVRCLWNILPLEFLSRIELSSVCTSPTNDEVEDVLLIPQDDASGRLSSITNRITRANHIDLQGSQTPGGDYDDLGQSIFVQLLDGNSWYDITWNEKRSLCCRYLKGRYLGETVDLIDLSTKLKQMKETIDSIESLEHDESGLL